MFKVDRISRLSGLNQPGSPSMYKTIIWIAVLGCVFIWSAIGPKDRPTWFLEVFPVIIGVVALAVTYNSFRLTSLLYVLILLHCIVLLVGGHYTYAEVPLFNEIKTLFGSERNNFDKLGHVMQGLVPAMIARELIIRLDIINGRHWRNFFIICFCLALSALYELLEWWVALLSEEAAEAFLGMQGYEWDTQSDMAYALIGAIAALLLLSKLHDRQLKEFH
jgi:putative membrane protein